MNVSGEIDLAAQSVLDDLCLESPVDAFAVAEALGVTVRDGPRACCSDAGTVFLGPTVRTERTHFDLAHELGHLLLGTDKCWQCNAFASALLVPRREFVLHCKRHGRDLGALKELHPWASYEVIARRYAGLHPGVTLWICDYPPDAEERLYPAVGRGPFCTTLEECVALARWQLQPARIDNLTAWPVLDSSGWLRVLALTS